MILGHLPQTRYLLAQQAGLSMGDLAHLGVTVFFVISGFLITTLLQHEYARHGSISLPLFYGRRALRILPPSMAYIGVIAAFAAAGAIQLHHHDLLAAVTYTTNYHPNGTWDTGHLWSLSVEEQFYLLWPLAFAAAGPRKAFKIALAVVALGPVARIAAAVLLRGSVYRNMALFPVVADSLAAGCALALARDWLERRRWYLALFHPYISGAILVVVIATSGYLERRIILIFGTSAINIGAAILVHRSVYRARSGIGRALNWKPLMFCGVLSYSLYLWQQPFLDPYRASWWTAFPQNLLAACAAALASYFLLEKPLLRLRSRLRRAATTVPAQQRDDRSGMPLRAA